MNNERFRVLQDLLFAHNDAKTPEEWSKIFGVCIVDPDGWRAHGIDWKTKLMLNDFLRFTLTSTIGPRDA